MSGAGPDGRTRDTNANGHVYRYYGGSWYPVYRGMISPTTYHGGSYAEISHPGYHPSRITHSARGVRSGGFGSSAHSSFGG